MATAFAQARSRATSEAMPTQPVRHTVMETPEIAVALDAASLVWPGESHTDLVARMIVAAGNTFLASGDRRREIVEKWAGVCPDRYGSDWDELRKTEWSE